VSDCERWIEIADRHAVGERVTDTDETFAREHALACDACAREAHAFLAIEKLEPDALPASPRTEVDAVVARVRRERRVFRVGRVAAVAGVFAAAAAILFLLRDNKASVRESVRDVVSARAIVDRGEVHADGARCAEGCAIARGAHLVADRDTCIRIDGGVMVCLDARSEATYLDASMERRRVELSRGRAVVSLGHQPEGTSFAIQTPAGEVRAIGTVFTVVVGSSVELHALEGIVAIESPERHERVEAPALFRFESGERSELPRRNIDADRALLEGRPAETAVDAGETPANPETKATPLASPDAGTRMAAAPPSVAELLARARAARASSQFKDAVAAYEELERTHAGDPAARAALVSLGSLQLDALRDPRAALTSFEAYIRSGDTTLLPEAREGRIRALRSMGLQAQEASAIREFVTQHPTDPRAAAMRARLVQLGNDLPNGN
jgi:hypothetical protein